MQYLCASSEVLPEYREYERAVTTLAAYAPPSIATRPLGGSKLGRAAARGELPSTWFPPRPGSTAEWRSRIDEVRGDILGGLSYGSNWYQIWVGQGYTADNKFVPLRAS